MSYVFAGEVLRLYCKIADSHKHAYGPWPAILRRVEALGLPAGARLLDLASGHGEPAMTIAKAFPSLEVVSTDFSESMVEVAKSSCSSAMLSNISCAVADMCDLSAFAENSFDCVVCCYGFMFPADKSKAFAEALRVLKPGGKLITTYWKAINLLQLSREVMTHVCDGVAPPVTQQQPLSLKEPGAFDLLATSAGFELGEIDVEAEYPFDLGTDEADHFKFVLMGFKALLDEHDPAPHPKAQAAFDALKENYLYTPEEADLCSDDAGTKIIRGNHFVMAVVKKPL